MTAPGFELQHSTIPQPTLLDEEIATHDWPLPPVKVWAPLPPLPEPGSFVMVEPPRTPSLWARLSGVFR